MPHFTYSEGISRSELLQGDILRRTPALEAVLQDVFPHYFNKVQNRYFIVLTQSCDLVCRDGTACAADYISIAPVRLLTALTKRQIERYRLSEVAHDSPICSEKNRQRYQNFLERLFNNNEPEFFFLQNEPTAGFPDDCCAFLALSIALRTDLHYQTCLSAKLLQLNEAFQAKLGWLVGQMYSRIGTEDWPKEVLSKKVRDVVRTSAIWIPEKSKQDFVRLANEWVAQNAGSDMTETDVISLLKKIPNVKDKVREQVMSIAEELFQETLAINPQLKAKLANRLRNDDVLASLLRG